MYWLALAWVYTVPSSVAAGVMYQQPLCGLKVHLVWSVPAVPGSSYLASLTPDSAGLTLIQPVWPFSWSDPLFSQSDPYSADPYSAGLTPIQLVWWVPTAPVGVEGSLWTFSACSIWVPLFSALRERNWLLKTSQPWHFIMAAETSERGKSFNVQINWI